MDFGVPHSDDGDESSGYCSLESESDSELFPDEEDVNDSTGVGDKGGDDSYYTMNMGSEDPEGNVGPYRRAEDFLDKEFASEEDALVAYKGYAKLRGFSVRKGDVGRINGVVVRRDFFCHRQGLRRTKHYDCPDRVREEKMETRTDCKAKLKIHLDAEKQVWRVRKIVDDHNHEMAPAIFSNLIPTFRKITEGVKSQVDCLKKFGITTSKVMAYVAGQSGGFGMLRFTKKDLYNYVHGQRRARIIDGDAALTISYLAGKADGDLHSTARYTTTKDERLGSLLWTDGIMKSDYHLFGDVVAFDATYRSNKYKKPLVVFSGVNHHRQTSIFAFALLEDEEIATYRWVLANLLEIMEGKMPSLVVTDGDKAMRAAIKEVFPSARHRLCAWHLEKNCVQRVKDVEFRRVFKKAIYANFDEDELENYWRASVEQLNLSNNSWVQSTYEIRESWATAYLRGTFCARYRTTSRCEGINSFVKAFLKSTDSMLELVNSLDRVVKDYRHNEMIAQFYDTYYRPVLTTGLDSIESCAARLYTREVFREVKKQIKGVAALLFQGRDAISTTVVYKFSKAGNRSRVYKVLYDQNENKLECECRMWDSDGIPCSHIFCAMKYEGLVEIPPVLILRRWCKDAKEVVAADVGSIECDRTQSMRYAALNGWMSMICTLGCEDAKSYELAQAGLSSVEELLKRSKIEKDKGKGIDLDGATWSNLKDPNAATTKGAPKKGKESAVEGDNMRGRKRKCTSCGVAGHTKRTCTIPENESGWGFESGGSMKVGADSSPGASRGLSSTSTRGQSASKMQNSRPGQEGGAPEGSQMQFRTQCNSCVGGFRGGGGTILLGGQHIEQFYATQSCSPGLSLTPELEPGPCQQKIFLPVMVIGLSLLHLKSSRES